MRRVIYGGAVSLDGYLATAEGGLDWLMWGEEAAQIMRDSWARFDTILMGRKTFDFSRQAAGSGSTGSEIRTIVFSRRQPPGFQDGVIFSNSPGPTVRQLKQEAGREICLMGGGEIAAALLDEDLIDEIGLNVHPVLLGSGIPAFPRHLQPTKWELQECRPFQNGCLFVVYQRRR